MLHKRIIPCLSIIENRLVKTINFKNPNYIGDPINAVKIFNEKEVDELIVVDIRASLNQKGPNLDLIKELASECFMPFAYGGGITNLEQVYQVLRQGAEKIILNSSSTDFKLIKKISSDTGASSLVISVDVRKSKKSKKYECYLRSGTRKISFDLIEFIKKIELNGAGEIFLNSIDRDGTMQGFDLELIELVSRETDLPLIACGGAGNYDHIKEAFNSGADAVGAGSLFVYHGPFRAVLINYPDSNDGRIFQ